MKFTGTLGNPASMPGHLVLGSSTKLIEKISQSLSLTQTIVLDFPHFYADVLNLTQTIDANAVKFQTDNLNLRQIIDYELAGSPSTQSQYCVHSDLNLVETISYTLGHVLFESITDYLNLTQPCITVVSTHVGRIIFRAITDNLNLIQNITGSVSVTHTESITDNLNLHDVISPTTGNILTQSLTDTLAFTETLYNNHQNDLIDTLVFNESITYTFGDIFTESVTDTLVLTDNNTDLRVPAGAYSFTDTLNFTETIVAFRVHNIEITDNLSLGDNFNKFAQNRQFIHQKLLLTDTVQLGTIIHLSLTDTIVFKNFYEVPLNFNKKITLPIINRRVIPAAARAENYGNQINPAYVRVNNVPAGKFKSFILLTGTDGSISLPPPLFGDSYGLDNEVKIGRSMLGTVYSYVKTSKYNKLLFTFSLSRNKTFELFSFYQKNCSDQIYLTDWNYNYYAGFILSEPLSSTQDRAYDNRIELSLQVMKII